MAITLQNSLYGWRADAATNAEANHPLYGAISGLAGWLNESAKRKQDEAERQKAEAIAAIEAEWTSLPQVFVRFGSIPAGGRSYNFGQGHYEAGISVFEGRQRADGTLWLRPSVGSLLTIAGAVLERPAYLCQGEIVGTGSDGEPCLKLKGRARRIKGRKIETPLGAIEAK